MLDRDIWRVSTARALRLQGNAPEPADDHHLLNPFAPDPFPGARYSDRRERSWSAVHPILCVQAYRCVRHAGIIAGVIPPDQPLFFITEMLGAKEAPVDPSRRPTTAPGFDIIRDRLECDPGVWRTQPPFPEDDASLAGFGQFFSTIRAVAEALDIGAESQFGLDEISEDLLHPDFGTLYAHWPSDAELLQVEHALLSGISDLLAESSERQARRTLLESFPCGPFEAFSLIQAGRRWVAAHRPVDIQVDRALLLAELDAAADQARQNHDHRAVVATVTQRARILGLYEHGDSKSRNLQEAFEGFREFVQEHDESLRLLGSSAEPMLPGLPDSITESPFAPLPEDEI